MTGHMTGQQLRSNFEPGSTRWAMRRAQWSALGLSEQDMEQPKIAIVNSSSRLASCFSHLDGLGRSARGGDPRGRRVPVRDPYGRSERRHHQCGRGRSLHPAQPRPHRQRHRGRRRGRACSTAWSASPPATRPRPAHLMAAGRLNIPTIVVGCGYQPSGVYRGEHVDFEDIFLVRRPRRQRRDDRRGAGGDERRRGHAAPACAPAWARPTRCTSPPRRWAWRCPGARRCWPTARRMFDDDRPRRAAHRGDGGRGPPPARHHDRRAPSATPWRPSSPSPARSTASSTCRRSPSRHSATSTSTRCSRSSAPQVPLLARRQAQRRPAHRRVRGRRRRPGAAAPAARTCSTSTRRTVAGGRLARSLGGATVADAESSARSTTPLGTGTPGIVILRGSLAPDGGDREAHGRRRRRAPVQRSGARCSARARRGSPASASGAVEPGHVVVLTRAGPARCARHGPDLGVRLRPRRRRARRARRRRDRRADVGAGEQGHSSSPR